MKKLILIVKLSICFTWATYAQDAPSLQLTGTKPSLSKGTIDTELLTKIIQKKQEEIKQRIFRNTIIKQFNKYKYTERLNNFTTYNYLYSLMDVLTSGKNKTVMTKSLIESSTEFAFIYGLTLYAYGDFVENSKITYEDSSEEGKNVIILDKPSLTDFNIRVDMCYDILLENEDELLKLFDFKQSLRNPQFKEWYGNDNKYLEALETNPSLAVERAVLKQKIEAFLQVAGQLKQLHNRFANAIKDKTMHEELNRLLSSFQDMEASQLDERLEGIESNLDSVLKQSLEKELLLVKAELLSLKEFYDGNSENLMHLLDFYRGLEKSNFKEFTLTKDQYYAMKFIVVQFIEQARGQYLNNDVISSVLDYFLENTLVEYTEYINGQVATITEDNAENTDKGYLFVNVESLISSIDANLGSVKHKRFLNYVTPFLSIGTNYAVSKSSNDLGANNAGTTESIDDLYFASEKIGIKWKLWNWKYTHAFAPGEEYNYYKFKKLSWKRPQEEPLLSDLHLMAYASGFLYNLIDLKSEDEFDYALLGGGVGITFFNGLSVNIGMASPITKISIDNSFVNFGIDIPIIEYISALTKPNK